MLFNISVIWVLFAFLFLYNVILIEKSLVTDRNLLLFSLAFAIIGFVVAAALVFYLKNAFHKYPLWLSIVLKMVITFFIFLIAAFIILAFYYVFGSKQKLNDYATGFYENVFLTREKTLSRKLEEILLVYILENNRIASKSRMLEVYFNVIEWGPNVYGIGEAAQFYFQKRPSELSLNECLYLASIVPKPKKFMWQFDNEGNQKPYAKKNQNYIKNLMLRRALITAEDTVGQSVPIYISGHARSFLKLKVVQDSIAVDSTLADEFDF